MRGRNAVGRFGGAAVIALLPAIATGGPVTVEIPRAVEAQPASSEMCGDGTTFTVDLPGTTLGIDDSDGIFRSIGVPPVGPPDSITLPNGCSLYVLLVSGYNQNADFDRITFYKVAEFAAHHNGYVHVAWWNNLLKPYMAGPLHPVTITIDRLFLPDLTVPPNPGGYSSIQQQATLVPDDFIDLPKANPDEDFQFQSDAYLMIMGIKAHNPDALIIVAGHSMGADAVARLGWRHRDLPIDLLAVIDPGNNRDKPRGKIGTPEFNWTRWRSTHDFLGYKRWDCVRNGLGGCRDFDSRLFHVSYRCSPVGDWIDRPPLITTFAPLACPYAAYADPGVRRTIGSNVRNLYYRWQREYLFPFDFLATERFDYPASLSDSIQDSNYQQPILRNEGNESDPNKTCADVLAIDPRRGGSYSCSPFDGHGEIVGMRALQGLNLVNPKPHVESPGLQMRNWSEIDRRDAFIAMATAGESWDHRPENPDLCMVCDDIIAITRRLLDERGGPTTADTTPPVTVATAEPGANDSGWNDGDVRVKLSASDGNGGSGVTQIEYSSSGAQVGGDLLAGASAETVIAAEGTTTVSFFARDNVGNVEAAKTLDVRIDRTPPDISADADTGSNASGWHNADVHVEFSASDVLSGLTFTSPPITVSSEGTNQEITGTARDKAGNSATGAVVLNIDKTPPVIALASRLPAANAAGWNRTDVAFTWNCTDTLSEPVSATVSQSVVAEGQAQTATGTCFDAADNTASDVQTNVSIDKTPPAIVGSRSPSSNANGWNNGSVTASFTCDDALSGLAPGSPPAPITLTGEGANQSVPGTCVDRADNPATMSVQGINIDVTAPTITIATSSSTLWPPNGKPVAVTVSGVISDTLSGIGPTAAFNVIDKYGAVQPSGMVSVGSDGHYSLTINLEAARLDTDRDGRTYEITVSAEDKAGNPASASTIVWVPHDQGQ